MAELEETIDPQPKARALKAALRGKEGNRGGCLVTSLSPPFSSLDLTLVKRENWGSNLRKMVGEVISHPSEATHWPGLGRAMVSEVLGLPWGSLSLPSPKKQFCLHPAYRHLFRSRLKR